MKHLKYIFSVLLLVVVVLIFCFQVNYVLTRKLLVLMGIMSTLQASNWSDSTLFWLLIGSLVSVKELSRLLMAETKHRTNWEKYFFHINSDEGSKVTNGCGCDVSSGYWVLLADIIWTFSLVSAHLPLSIEYMNIHFRSGNIHERCLPATIIIVHRKALSFLLPDQTLFRNLIPMMLLVYNGVIYY